MVVLHFERLHTCRSVQTYYVRPQTYILFKKKTTCEENAYQCYYYVRKCFFCFINTRVVRGPEMVQMTEMHAMYK